MIIHHKVTVRAVCVFSVQDTFMAARSEQHWQHQLQQQRHHHVQQHRPGQSSSPSSTSLSRGMGHPSQVNGAFHDRSRRTGVTVGLDTTYAAAGSWGMREMGSRSIMPYEYSNLKPKLECTSTDVFVATMPFGRPIYLFRIMGTPM